MVSHAAGGPTPQIGSQHGTGDPVERRPTDDLAEVLSSSALCCPEGLLATDADGRVVWANDLAHTVLGRPADALVGQPLHDLVPGHLAEEARTLCRRVRDGERVGTVTLGGAGPDASPLPVELTAAPRLAADGRPVGLSVLVRRAGGTPDATAPYDVSDEFLSRLHRRTADPAVVVDPSGRLRYVSPAFTRMLGHRADQVGGRPVVDLLHPDDAPAAGRALADLVGGRRRTARLTLRGRTPAGEWRWFDAVATACLDDASIAGLVVNLREVTAEVEARERLRRSESRYRAILETAQEGIIAVDPEGRVLFANDRFADLLGVPVESLYADGVLDRFAPEQRAWLRSRIAHRAEIGPEQYEIPYDHPTRGDMLLSFSAAPLREDDGATVGALATVTDVTEESQVRDELRRAALHDPLTGLPNRMLLLDRLAKAESRLEREPGRALAVLFLDLDDFKPVNDTHGHAVGDRLLVEVAGRLAAAVRDLDTVARLGGDEFAVVCEQSDVADAEAVAARIQAALAEPFDLGGLRLCLRVSIGVAVSPPDRPGDLLGLADQAMYRSKERGRGQVTVHRPAGPASEAR